MTMPGDDVVRSVTSFIQREALMLDERLYQTWETLWTAEGIYWIPAEDGEPQESLSIVYDDRARLAMRVRQLSDSRRSAVRAQSRTARVVTGIEPIRWSPEELEVQLRSSFVLFESRADLVWPWAGSLEHRLRDVGHGDWRLVMKKVVLINRADPIPTLGFLL